jgi:uncharacterized protein involved in type VI secretion and phage assembly
VPGLVVGVVTNIQDPENLGRVKVKLTVRDDDNNESAWARVLAPFAGSKMGAYFLPDVDDEVVVAFLGGQLEKPIVIGAVWNKSSKPPVGHDEGKNKTKVIKTKTGHELTFFDDDEGSVELKTAAGQKVTMDDKAKKLIVSDSSGGNTVSILEKSGTIQIKADSKIEIKAGSASLIIDGKAGKISMQGNNINAKGVQIEMKADATLSLKSDGMLEAKSSGITQVKGNPVSIN